MKVNKPLVYVLRNVGGHSLRIFQLYFFRIPINLAIKGYKTCEFPQIADIAHVYFPLKTAGSLVTGLEVEISGFKSILRKVQF